MEIGMKKVACRYSIVRFLPYQETGEFANVGIVLTCPETGYFDFKVQSRRYSRITDFFAELDSKVYLESIKLFAQELKRVQNFIREEKLEAEGVRKVFQSLTHPREAIVQLTESRPRLCDEPENMLEQLFRYYVEREFSTHEYRDTVVLRRVKALVDGLKLERPFKAVTLGDEFVSAHFPLAQYASKDDVEKVDKIIKPFALNHDEPSKIIQHGALWVDRIRRLHKQPGVMPKNVLFAVDGPSQAQSSKCKIAFDGICEELREQVTVVPSHDKDKIAEFAQAA